MTIDLLLCITAFVLSGLSLYISCTLPGKQYNNRDLDARRDYWGCNKRGKK